MEINFKNELLIEDINLLFGNSLSYDMTGRFILVLM